MLEREKEEECRLEEDVGKVRRRKEERCRGEFKAQLTRLATLLHHRLGCTLCGTVGLRYTVVKSAVGSKIF